MLYKQRVKYCFKTMLIILSFSNIKSSFRELFSFESVSKCDEDHISRVIAHAGDWGLIYLNLLRIIEILTLNMSCL